MVQKKCPKSLNPQKVLRLHSSIFDAVAVLKIADDWLLKLFWKRKTLCFWFCAQCWFWTRLILCPKQSAIGWLQNRWTSLRNCDFVDVKSLDFFAFRFVLHPFHGSSSLNFEHLPKPKVAEKKCSRNTYFAELRNKKNKLKSLLVFDEIADKIFFLSL